MNDSPMKVDFLIAGVQKGGTTALWYFLRQHPQIFMPDEKELHFFDNEAIDWSGPPYDERYHCFFRQARQDQLRGEATPIYMYWTPSSERIRHYNPRIKIIASLRNPVERAISHWAMEYSRGTETLLFSDAIRAGRERVARGAEVIGCHRVFSYVERGYYAPQLRRLFGHFPRSNVLVVRQEAMAVDLPGTLDMVCDFLGLARFTLYPAASAVRPTERLPNLPPISDQDRAYLRSLFLGDSGEVEQLTGHNPLGPQPARITPLAR